MSYCVYKHTFPNGKVYIGITSMKPEYRWNYGRGYMGKNSKGEYTQLLMTNAILKYGWDNIEHEVICTGLSKKEAERKEIELIAKYKSNNREFGYNIANGGSAVGSVSEQTRVKMSKSHKGKKLSEESKRKLSEKRKGENNPFYGKHHSEETKAKLKIANGGVNGFNYGKHLSEETKAKLSKINKDRFQNKENHPMYGKQHSEETKRKLSESKKGKPNPQKRKPVRCIETNEIFSSAKEAAEEKGVSSAKISSVCNGKRNTTGGYHWEFVNEDSFNSANERRNRAEKLKIEHKKRVRCIETNIVYESLTCAAKETKIILSGIGNACRGKSKTAGGYHWEYVDEDISNHQVKCVETNIVYCSATSASKETGINGRNINDACRGKQNTAGGYHWEFVDDPTQ